MLQAYKTFHADMWSKNKAFQLFDLTITFISIQTTDLGNDASATQQACLFLNFNF